MTLNMADWALFAITYIIFYAIGYAAMTVIWNRFKR